MKSAWDEVKHKWVVSVRNADGHVFDDQADVVISAMGGLDRWSWPDILGLESFKGKLMHSAQWDEEFEKNLDEQDHEQHGSGWSAKRVAVIGVVSASRCCTTSRGFIR